MKKLLVILFMTLLVASGAKAQTYSQNQSLVNSANAKLEKRLEEIKDRIYYLEVTLDSRINKIDSSLNPSYFKKELRQLNKEKHFAAEDLITLKAERIRLEKTIKNLNETGLAGTEFRTQSDMKSNLPEKMGKIEYKDRTRSQMFKASEGTINGEPYLKEWPGLLINYKTGLNELATFTIVRVGFPEFPEINKTLNPGERLPMTLPIGTYKVDIQCGSFFGSVICNVDPRTIKHCDNKDVYWYAAKTMSDF